MKTKFSTVLLRTLLLASVATAVGCQRDVNDLSPATNPKNGEVFIDAFTSGLNYSAYSGAVPEAFDTDKSVKYSGTASMRFAVPDYNDPAGSYAGGSFYTSAPRDLSGFNALTFYIKASQAANIDVIGFGNDMGENKYQVSLSNLPVNSNWKKVIIPIPDPSKLVGEKGMFFVSEGPENGRGYTFWVDEVKFENVGTIAYKSATILNGENRSTNLFTGFNYTVDGLSAIYNMPNGVDQAVNLTPYYFNFASSNTAAATVSETGVVTSSGTGKSVITATLGGNKAAGSLSVNSAGQFVSAPVPTKDPSKVVSIFSDKYTNVPVDYYNGMWAPYQTTTSADFVVNNDHVLNYNNFNFVGIQTSKPTVDASATTHFHMDLYLPNAMEAGAVFKVEILDFGADGVIGGNDDTKHETAITAPKLRGQSWVSIDLPFSAMTNLASRKHIGQIIFSGEKISQFYADNIYFYNDGSIIPLTPTVAAPVPTHAAGTVLSVFSDTYGNLAGTDFNPYWGQATVTTQVPIAGNNTLKYAGLNYQGTQFPNTDVSAYKYLHIDYYTANSSALNFYLISPGPVETPYSLPVPSGAGTATGWKSIDIPLSAFSPVDLSNIFQFKVEGNGDIYFDNIYFHN